MDSSPSRGVILSTLVAKVPEGATGLKMSIRCGVACHC